MPFTYIKFNSPQLKPAAKKESTLKKAGKEFFMKALSALLSVANPDFEKEFDKVHQWLIEYDTENDYTNREIGLNKKGKAIIISPWKRNYGFWLDTDMKLTDYYAHFNATNIDEREFNEHWHEFN